MYTNTRTHKHTCTRTHTNTRTRAHTHIHTRPQMHAYTNTRPQAHTYTNTHIHTFLKHSKDCLILNTDTVPCAKAPLAQIIYQHIHTTKKQELGHTSALTTFQQKLIEYAMGTVHRVHSTSSVLSMGSTQCQTHVIIVM